MTMGIDIPRIMNKFITQGCLLKDMCAELINVESTFTYFVHIINPFSHNTDRTDLIFIKHDYRFLKLIILMSHLF